MKNKFLLFFLLSLILCACQRETYEPTEPPDDAVSALLSIPSATPGLAADTNPATPEPDWDRFYFGEPGKCVAWVHISAPESGHIKISIREPSLRTYNG